jgi:hypothetical protein
MNEKKWMVRHGDLLLEKIETMPTGMQEKKTRVLLDGEVTGHAHRLDCDSKQAAIYEKEGVVYIHVVKESPLVHEEHRTIVLPPGDYQMTRQREWNPYKQAIRNVQD